MTGTLRWPLEWRSISLSCSGAASTLMYVAATFLWA
jgi:hypothetical protein